jgi:hypothetical protein
MNKLHSMLLTWKLSPDKGSSTSSSDLATSLWRQWDNSSNGHFSESLLLGPAIGSAADIRFFDFTSNGQFLVMVTQAGTINFCVKVWETRGDTLLQEMLIPHRVSMVYVL